MDIDLLGEKKRLKKRKERIKMKQLNVSNED